MRVLILSADIGAGHDLPAAWLRAAMIARHPGIQVDVADTIEASGPIARALLRSGSETVLERLPWLYDLEYALITRHRGAMRLGAALADAVCGPGLLRTIARVRPDVVVATYPLATQVLGTLRAAGRLDVPLVSAITDLAALRYWAHPGCDLHLTIHPESEPEIRWIAGPSTRVVAVRGFSDAAFETPLDRSAARRALALDPGRPVVVVSGGGWGIGDLEGAVRAATAADPRAQVLALCGTNEPARVRLERTVAGDDRVRALGFTERMPEILAAADVLVHSTAGLTVFEALVRGARVISYGWGVGHIRVNNRAYRAYGLADVVEGREALVPAVRRALASPGQPDLAYGARPAAADLVAALARGALEPGDGPRRPEQGPAA